MTKDLLLQIAAQANRDPIELLLECINRHGITDLLPYTDPDGETGDPYVVAFAVDGRYYAHVHADSAQDAVRKAEDACSNADFGALETIDWSVDHVEDKHGNILDEPTAGPA